VSDFQKAVDDKEADFMSRLIEAFGYPYAADIGPLGTYPSGYNGPDLYHYMYAMIQANSSGFRLRPWSHLS
jgi:hypothetical protein